MSSKGHRRIPLRYEYATLPLQIRQGGLLAHQILHYKLKDFSNISSTIHKNKKVVIVNEPKKWKLPYFHFYGKRHFYN